MKTNQIKEERKSNKQQKRINQKKEKEKLLNCKTSIESQTKTQSIVSLMTKDENKSKEQCIFQLIITSDCELLMRILNKSTMKEIRTIEINECCKYHLVHEENQLENDEIQNKKDMEIIISTCIHEIMIQPNQINSYIVVNKRNETVIKTTNSIMSNYIKSVVELIERNYIICNVEIVVEYDVMYGNEIVGNFKEITKLINQRWEMIMKQAIVLDVSTTIKKRSMIQSLNQLESEEENNEMNMYGYSEETKPDEMNIQSYSIFNHYPFTLFNENETENIIEEKIEIKQHEIKENEITTNSNNEVKTIKMIINEPIEESEINKILIPNETNKKLTKLNKNHLHIVSRYFNSIDDFVHLEMGVKSCRGNLERFKYNPVSINDQTIKLFPNIKVMHIYREEDKFIRRPQISKYVVWHKIGLYFSLKLRQNIGIKIDFKKIIFTKEDKKKALMKQRNYYYQRKRKSFSQQKLENETEIIEIEKDDKEDKETIEITGSQKRRRNDSSTYIDIVIPNGVNEIENECFKNSHNIKSISIPQSVTYIGKDCFIQCNSLTNMIIPTSEYEFFFDYRLLHYYPHFHAIHFPSSLKVINGMGIDLSIQTQLTTLLLPSYVTSIQENCFFNSHSLEYIHLPETIQIIGNHCFDHCINLKEIVIPSSLTYFQSNWFNGCSNLTKIVLSDSITQLDANAFANYSSLKEIVLPLELTSLPKRCFFKCISLSKIERIEQIKTIGNSCFNFCSSLTNLPLHLENPNEKQNNYNKLPSIFTEEQLRNIMSLTETKQYASQKLYSFFDVQNWIGNQNENVNENEIFNPFVNSNLNDNDFNNCNNTNTNEIRNELNINDKSKSEKKEDYEDIFKIENNDTKKKRRKKSIKKETKQKKQNIPIIQIDDEPENEMMLTEKDIHQIEEWTSLKIGEKIFDTQTDNWSNETSEFDDKVMNKSKLLFVMKDSTGEKFGCYLFPKIYFNKNERKHPNKRKRDTSTFLFNLKSNGRLPTPMKFEILKDHVAFILYNKSHKQLITFGNPGQIRLFKQEERDKCTVIQSNSLFNYHNVKTAVSGKYISNPFYLERMVVIQMVNENGEIEIENEEVEEIYIISDESEKNENEEMKENNDSIDSNHLSKVDNEQNIREENEKKIKENEEIQKQWDQHEFNEIESSEEIQIEFKINEEIEEMKEINNENENKNDSD